MGSRPSEAHLGATVGSAPPLSPGPNASTVLSRASHPGHGAIELHQRLPPLAPDLLPRLLHLKSAGFTPAPVKITIPVVGHGLPAQSFPIRLSQPSVLEKAPAPITSNWVPDPQARDVTGAGWQQHEGRLRRLRTFPALQGGEQAVAKRRLKTAARLGFGALSAA